MPMLSFTELGRKTPPKRDADARRADFGDIYGAFEVTEARAQASRCSQCGIPFLPLLVTPIRIVMVAQQICYRCSNSSLFAILLE